MRQVTHALLTRPPLSHKNNQSEEIKFKCFVRLACVKHAASVHPEPGSNSHVKVFQTLFDADQMLYLATVLRLLLIRSVRLLVISSLKSLLNLSRLFTVQLSMFVSPHFVRSFCCCFSSQRQLINYITVEFVCQQLFLFFVIALSCSQSA